MLQNIAILLLLSASALIAFAQQPAPQAVDRSGTIESLHLPPAEQPTAITPTSGEREGLIHLDVAARGQDGRPFGNVADADLTLLQDGTPTKILSFHRSNSSDENERLTEVCLVLDEVDLTPVEFAYARNAAIEFLRRNDGVLAQPFSVLWIKSDGVYTSAFPTTDGNSLAGDIVSNRAFPTTWMFHPAAQLGVTPRDARWDEVLRTVYALAAKWRDKPGRKALLWIGYGWSILGKLDAKGGPFPILVELSTRIREARMVIYDVTPWPDPEIDNRIPAIDYRHYLSGVRSPTGLGPASSVPYFALSVLAVQSGGLALNDSKDLEGDIGSCVVDAGDFYTVSFDPPRAAQPDEFHDLSVLIGKTQFSARTSYGFYDQPVFYDQPPRSQRINTAELRQFIELDRGEHDKEMAERLNELELTERLSTAQLAIWKQGQHGKRTKDALTALGDNSVFLAPPNSDAPAGPAPDDTMQRQIVQRAEQYLDEVVPKLPDFSADATTIKYEQSSPGERDTWKAAPQNRALIRTVTEQATLLYRNGHEQRIVEKEAETRVAARYARNNLNFRGIFGPLLGFVLADVRSGNSKLTFAGWERNGQKTLAVFRYSVRAENPNYGVLYCCLASGQVFDTLPEHHGELSIDPGTGAILRITVESEPGWIRETDLSPLRPVLFSNMMVEYGPVDIGGRKFVCPLRSVVITRETTVRPLSFWGVDFPVYGPFQTLMDDTMYRNYHKFGAEVQVLLGFEVVKDGKDP